MPRKKISALPDADALTGSELVAIVQDGVTKKTTVNAIRGVTPTITVSETTLTFPDTGVDEISASQTFTVSGSNLSANIVITAPAGFIINLDNSTDNDSPITLTQSGGTVNSTTIYASFAPTAEQAYSGNITATSTGATTRNVAVSGEGIPLTPTLINKFLDSDVPAKGDLWNPANYTNQGGLATFGANYIDVLGGAGNFNNWLELNTWITDRENLKWVDTWTMTGISGSTAGLGMQLHSNYNQFITFALGLDNGGNNGDIIVFTSNGSILAQQVAAIPDVATGNIVRMTLERINGMQLKFTVDNVTQGTTASYTQQYSLSPPFGNSEAILPVVSKFKRLIFGANARLTNTYVEAVGEYTYPDAIFCGDSKWQGYFATGNTTANRWIDLIKSAHPSRRIYCNSGVNETISDFVSKLPEILSYGSDPARKTKVYIGVGCNDIRNATFNGTTQTALINAFNSLKDANFDPYICHAMPENAQDNSPFNTWASAQSAFTGKVITGTWTAIWSGSGTTPNPTYINADGIHPSQAGQTPLSLISEFNTFN